MASRDDLLVLVADRKLGVRNWEADGNAAAVGEAWAAGEGEGSLLVVPRKTAVVAVDSIAHELSDSEAGTGEEAHIAGVLV